MEGMEEIPELGMSINCALDPQSVLRGFRALKDLKEKPVKTAKSHLFA
jgi:hypothetical protein